VVHDRRHNQNFDSNSIISYKFLWLVLQNLGIIIHSVLPLDVFIVLISELLSRSTAYEAQVGWIRT
jgi:hypothetical protein